MPMSCADSLHRPPTFLIGCFLAEWSTNIIIQWQYSFIKVRLNPQDTSPTQQTENLAQWCAHCVCYLLVIAVVIPSPVWRYINEWHASTFCWNICDREISGIFPDIFCALDQIFIRAIKAGMQHCCVWFFNKLGHAFVRGVKKKGSLETSSYYKKFRKHMTAHQTEYPKFFFPISSKCEISSSLDIYRDLQVLKCNQKCKFFFFFILISQIKWLQRWHYLRICSKREHAANMDF